MLKPNLDCTIIILSYNNRNIIRRCLRSALESARICEKTLRNRVEVVVVDNGSTDGSVAYIHRVFPEITLLALRENVGCSEGNNLAMRQATTPFILLLNSDAFLNPDTLVQSIAFMGKHPKTSVLAARQLHDDGSFQATCGFLPTPLRTILWSFGAEQIPFLKELWHPIYQFNQNFYKKNQEIGWCTTSFFFLRQTVFQKTGGQDSRIRVHMEDVEWCKRIYDAGFVITYSPDICITHLGGGSTKKFSKAKLLSQHVEGLRYYHTKHHATTWFLVQSMLRLGLKIRSAYYLLRGNYEFAHAYSSAL